MKCIAVDDEPLALALLQDNIRQVPGLELVASCSTAMEALAVLNRTGSGPDFPGYSDARTYRPPVTAILVGQAHGHSHHGI